MYVFDPVDVPGDVAQGIPAGPVGGFGPAATSLRGGTMTKQSVNQLAKHVAIAAAVVFVVTKFV